MPCSDDCRAGAFLKTSTSRPTRFVPVAEMPGSHSKFTFTGPAAILTHAALGSLDLFCLSPGWRNGRR
jgi:hypothetical protein